MNHISLRDQFALAAMQAIVSNPSLAPFYENKADIAKAAYEQADEMINERNRTEFPAYSRGELK